MKYEAKDVGGVATSQAAGLPWVTISQTNAIAEASALGAGYHLITESEWLTIAQNIISVGSNWSGGTVGSGSMYRGHTDNVPTNSLAAAADSDPYSGTGQTTGIERRTFTLTNGEVMWDLAGNVDEWTSGTTEGGNQPGAPGGIWREWNALTVAGNFSPDPFPAYASSSATAWTSAQSIGQIYSDSSQTGPRSFRRGGGWYYGSAGGLYSLSLSAEDWLMSSGTGFRVAR